MNPTPHSPAFPILHSGTLSNELPLPATFYITPNFTFLNCTHLLCSSSKYVSSHRHTWPPKASWFLNFLCTRHTHKVCPSVYFLSWATMTLNMNCKRGGEAGRCSAAWQQRPGSLQLSSSEVCAGAGTLGLCEWAEQHGREGKKKKKKVLHWHCIPLVMDLIIKMTNYSIKVSAR